MDYGSAPGLVPEFSFIRLGRNDEHGRSLAQVVCVCGWKDQEMPVSPFDPAEAITAAYASHFRCVTGKTEEKG